MAKVCTWVRSVSSKRVEGEAYIEPGQVLVAKGRHGVAEKGDGKEDEEHLVGRAFKYTNTGSGFVDIDACHKEEGGSKVD